MASSIFWSFTNSIIYADFQLLFWAIKIPQTHTIFSDKMITSERSHLTEPGIMVIRDTNFVIFFKEKCLTVPNPLKQRVSLVVGLVFLPQIFGPVVETYRCLLLFSECTWSGGSTCRWWRHLSTICCN